ncbi:uncharacterized protein LOC144557049 isoform X2 [Carex rostrata]
MEGIKKPPRRVQLLFDHFVTTKEQKMKGAHRIMVLIHANKNTVSEFFQDICDHLGLRCTSSHGPILKLKETIIPGFQPTSIFRDLDKIIVEGDFIKKRKKKAVATEKKIKEVRKRPLPEETGLKREQKEVQIPTSPKKACPGNGTQQSLPGHLIPGQPRFMSPAWEANGEAANVNESTPQQNGWDAWEPKH